MIAPAQRTLMESEAVLRQALRCDADQLGLITATVAEHIRALLFGADVSHLSDTWQVPLHTTRLLTHTRRVVQLMWPERVQNHTTHDDLCRNVLDCLKELGDVCSLEGGLWVATPIRLITTEASGHCLLLGTAPRSVAQALIRAPVFASGPSRIVESTAVRSADLNHFTQSLDAWLGSEAPLPQWIEAALAEHRSRLQTANDLPADQLEIYAPDVARQLHRSGRWVQASQMTQPMEGLRLCRPLERYAFAYDRPHYLGTFEHRHGTLHLSRYAGVAKEWSLRLRFGLDVVLGTPRHVRITTRGSTYSIERPMDLPAPEQRIYALGWRDPAASTGRIVFHAATLSIVLNTLKRLLVKTTVSESTVHD